MVQSSLKIKIAEIFGVTIQGEGMLTGCPSIFIRFATCNLYCEFCDTNFAQTMELTTKEIVSKVTEIGSNKNMVVITGGEPFVQREGLSQLVDALKEKDYFVQIETNGTFALGDIKPHVVVCSPKTSPDKIKLEFCQCVKFLYPYIKNVTPEDFKGHYFVEEPRIVRCIQPIEGYTVEVTERNLRGAIEEVKRLGCSWKLGLQIHKIIGEK